ncbi:MAG: Hpt domain-containing protein, partial [Burkholderiales bacterium]
VTIEATLEQQKRAAQNLFVALREKPEDGAAREKLQQNLEAIRQDADLAKDKHLQQQAASALKLLQSDSAEDAKLSATMQTLTSTKVRLEAPSAQTQRMVAASQAVVDQELLQIFLEEAQEVLATIAEHLHIVSKELHNTGALTTVRRGFHTLKGSGRMVGLKDLGEVAWSIEQVMNKWLQEEKNATPQLLGLIKLAHAAFSSWVSTLQDQGWAEIKASSITALADSLLHGKQETPAAAAPLMPETEEEAVVIGEARLAPALYKMYVEEAATHVATLKTECARLDRNGASEAMMRAAHTLSGISRTARFTDIAGLGSALEQWVSELIEHPASLSTTEFDATVQAVTRLEQMVNAVSARRVPESAEKETQELRLLLSAAITQTQPMAATEVTPPVKAAAVKIPKPARAAKMKPAADAPAETKPVEEEQGLTRERRAIRDDFDAQLLPVFLEEAHDLVPIIGEDLRSWRADPEDKKPTVTLARALHTLKGSARMAGAMRLGELTHNMESKVENAAQLGRPMMSLFEDLESQFDRMVAEIGKIKRTTQPEEAAPAVAAPAAEPEQIQVQAVLRVRADVVDRLVNEAGEVSIARARIEGEMRAFKGTLLELTASIARLRHQLREVEIQAESQMQSRLEQLGGEAQHFDPLEFDRFSRLQELTRLMAESVHDVSTVQQTLLKNLDDADAAISQQARLNRDLQDELMRVRTVPFSTIAERLYRIVRLTAKELGKKANLEIRGSQVELDRSVLEKIGAPLEHMLRNSIAHGIEDPGGRIANGKFETGEINIVLHQEANEIVIVLSDDGTGLNFERIREKGLELGLLQAGAAADENQLAQLIFASGFSTAQEVTELAGRGVGMDVVKAEVASLGGRVEVASKHNQGTSFTLHLPLTLAVAQAVLVRAAGRVYALPTTMVEQVQEPRDGELAALQQNHQIIWHGNSYPFHYLPRLLGDYQTLPEIKRYNSILLLRSGLQRVAIHVDEIIRNQEVVVKNLGAQLARAPGVVGATVLGSGLVVLIINPVLLLTREAAAPAAIAVAPAPAKKETAAPLIMVVDDSLTMRKITGRLLAREGYRVATAKDGVEALQQLQDVLPDVMLVDIEMPRMDGFDLTKNVRADARTAHIPIIMISSRSVDKHRNIATQLGVNVFLGKPYQEEDLLLQIANYIKQSAAV